MSLVDWNLAERLAGFVAGTPEYQPLPPGLEQVVAESERHVAAYSRLQPPGPLPPPELVGRPAWVKANFRGIRSTLEPLVDRAGASMGPLRPAASLAIGALLAAEVGVIFGYLSRRVLGQYELVILDPSAPPRLLFVEPNLAEAVVAFDAKPDELLRWVALHEVTHALQFSSVPWLREHLAGLLGELLEGMELKVNTSSLLKFPAREDLRGIVEAVRKGDLLTAALGPGKKATLDAVQATMAVLEGHAEHVMDAAGVQVLPSLPALRASMNRRRSTQSPLAKLLGRLLGMDMKMRQYEMGKAFCDEVVRLEGIEGLNRVWSGPEAVPTLPELTDARAWLARTAPPRLAA